MINAPDSGRNSFVFKILPATHCSPRIFSQFSPNSMIPLDQGGGGIPGSSQKFPFREFMILAVFALVLALSTQPALGQAQRGTLVHEETIRVAPSADAAKLGEAGRGHELIIIDTSRDWTHVRSHHPRTPQRLQTKTTPNPKARPLLDGFSARLWSA